MFTRNLLQLYSILVAHSSAAPAQQQQDRLPPEAHNTTCGYWPGFAKLANVFAFGDSYTSPGFKVTGSRPAPSSSGRVNETQLPTVEDHGGGVGPNWLAYLTGRDNASSIATYNFASPGATVDSRLVASILPANAHSLTAQITADWLPVYGARGEVQGRFRNSWGAEDSLFALWIGINDVLRTHATTDDLLMPAIFEQYAILLEELYNSGARNFLLLDVPRLQDAPVAKESPGSGATLTKAVANFNSRLAALTQKFRASHEDAMLTLFSASKVFTAIREDPAKYNITRDNGSANADSCFARNDNHNVPTIPCGNSEAQYFWLDLVHSSTRVHSTVAYEVSKHLSNVNARPQCTSPAHV